MVSGYGYSVQRMSPEDHLEHHGIKGQRWGIRRYQNEDGTLTEEGMRRYGIVGSDGKLRPGENAKAAYREGKRSDAQYKSIIAKEKASGKEKSKRRQQLEEDYKKAGLTQEQAEIQALKRERTERLLKVAGAVAVTAAVAYGAYKGRQWLAKNADYKIKAGSEIYRTTGNAGEDWNRAGYVVDNAKDADKYAGVYGSTIKERKGFQKLQSILSGKDASSVDDNVYQISGKAAKDVKVAGDRQAKKVYQELMKNDPEFARDNEVIRKNWAENLFAGAGKTDSYADFNTRLVDHDGEETARVQKKFYDALKAKGYGGVIDVNDRDQSGYHAKKPIILFNMQENVGERKVRTLAAHELQEKMASGHALMEQQARRDVTVESAMKSIRKYSGRAAVGTGIGLAVTKHNDRQNMKRGAYQKSVIKQYKKEHPNTKLTDNQILENELGIGA